MNLSLFAYSERCNRCRGKGFVSGVDHEKIGKWVREERRRHKITFVQLAERIGLSVGYLCDLEYGRRAWNDELFAKVIAGIHKDGQNGEVTK